MNSHRVNPFPAYQVDQVLHFWFYSTSGFTRDRIFGYEVLLPPVTEISSLALEGIAYSHCKAQAPFQRYFICSLMISKASHGLFCSPGNQILTVLTYPCLQRLLLCTHSTKLSISPLALPWQSVSKGRDARPLEIWFTVALCTIAAEETGFFWFKYRDVKCNPGRQERLWTMPSFTTPPQSFLQGYGELTLLVGIPAWAHPLHKSLLFSLLNVLNLYKCLHVFSQRSSLSMRSGLAFSF